MAWRGRTLFNREAERWPKIAFEGQRRVFRGETDSSISKREGMGRWVRVGGSLLNHSSNLSGIGKRKLII